MRENASLAPGLFDTSPCALLAGSVTAIISAVGVAAHGIGTARAFQVSEQAGAFAGLGMGMNGLVTAILAPLLLILWRWI